MAQMIQELVHMFEDKLHLERGPHMCANLECAFMSQVGKVMAPSP